MELETQGWKGVACEWPTLPPEAMVWSQSELFLRAMTESTTMWQELIRCPCLILPLENMGIFTLGTAVTDQVIV